MKTLLAAIAAFGLLASQALVASEKPRPVDLQVDRRLARRLSIPGKTVELGKVIALLSETTEADVMVQGDLLRRPISVAIKDKRCADIMENLAVLFGGSWVRQKESYILLTDAATANAVAAYPEQTSTTGAERSLTASLTAAQSNQLLSRGNLALSSLTPTQRRQVLAIIRDRYLHQPDRFPSSILNGRGVYLVSLKKVDADSNPPMVRDDWGRTLEIWGPMIEDDGSMDSSPIVVLR